MLLLYAVDREKLEVELIGQGQIDANTGVPCGLREEQRAARVVHVVLRVGDLGSDPGAELTDVDLELGVGLPRNVSLFHVSCANAAMSGSAPAVL